MATRGRAVGKGYISGLGYVIVFADMDNKDMFFVLNEKSGQTRYVSRNRVQFRKPQIRKPK